MPPSAVPFSRSLRSMRGDGYRTAFGAALIAAVLLTAWSVWMVSVRFSVYESSAGARTVAARAVHPIVSAVDGRVESVEAVLGQSVREGDVLLRLDTSAERLALEEQRARASSRRGELKELERQIAASAEARERAIEAAQRAAAAADAARHELELLESLAREDLARQERLAELGGVSEFEVSRARTEAERATAAIATHERDEERAALERTRALRDRESSLAALRRDRVKLEGELARGALELQRLETEITRRQLTAPAAGEVGELGALTRGSWVRAGATLATVVARSGLVVEAEFPAAAAVGRIRPGQSGRLRLDGFPWARYGSVPVTVARVGAEARDGRIQVELEVDGQRPPPVPLRHGLVGTVEVEVDRVTPFQLLLASVGAGGSDRDGTAAR